MNLLCPNCQKMLTIPDQYAGQAMRCPLCQGAFSVPALPSTPAPVSAPPPAPTPAPTEIYAMKNDGAAPKEEPFVLETAPSPPKKSAGPKLKPEPEPEFEPTAPPPPREYTHGFPVWISPRVLQWVAPIALLLVFVLTFFSWVGDYPGGFPVTTQSAWGAAFNDWTSDGNLTRDDSPILVGGEPVPFVNRSDRRPGFSLLTIFYLLLLIPTLLVVIALSIVPLVDERLPRQVRDLVPWRWAIALVIVLLALLPLLGQLLTGFGIENRAREVENKKLDAARAGGNEPSTRDRLDEAIFLDRFRRTNWLRAAVVLHFLAVVALALEFWIGMRSTRPLPRIHLHW